MPSVEVLLSVSQSKYANDERLQFFSKEDTDKYLRSLSKEIEYEYNTLPNLDDKFDYVVIDTETTGLGYPNNQLIGVGFWIPKLNKGYYFDNLDLVKQFLELLDTNNITWIGHNLKFDLKILHLNKINLNGNYRDTMILHYLIDSNDRHGLKYLVNKLLGMHITTYEEAMKENILAKYCISDCYHTWLLYEYLTKEFDNYDLYDLEMEVMKVLVNMEIIGVKIDIESANTMNQEILYKVQQIKGDLGWNPGSNAEINNFLYRGKGLIDPVNGSFPLQKSKTGLFSTNEGSLNKVKDLYPKPEVIEIVDKILEYRKLQKISSTYLLGIPNKAVNGILYTNFNQTVTTTGRLSSSNPNMQNIPSECKSLIVARDGYTLVSFDYSQCELRILAHYSRDPILVKSYRDRVDVHTRVTAELLGIDPESVNKEQRKWGKTLNFGMLYGMGPTALSQHLQMPLEQAKTLLERYWERLPRVRRWIDSQHLQCLSKGYTETIMGRRRKFIFRSIPQGQIPLYVQPQPRDPHDQAILRECVNFPIQGSNADLTKLAMTKVPNNDYCRLLLQIHDELVFEVLEDQLELWIPIVKETMTSVGNSLLTVNLEVDYKVSKCWNN